MTNFDKRMALGEIEDALNNVMTPHGRGLAIGLCGAFYMCGLLSAREWKTFMKRIPAEPSIEAPVLVTTPRSRLLN